MALDGTLMACSRQWMMRPDDERFESLPEMHEMMTAVRQRSKALGVSSKGLHATAIGDDHSGLVIQGPNGNPAAPTNFAFGQIAQRAGAPAAYIRKLPSALAADCINYGLQTRDVEDLGVLLTDNGRGVPEMRACTGPNYGRIWNSDIVQSLMARFGDGRTGDWRVPGEFGREVRIGKHNTTLYASDRDMFVFLCDEKNRVEVPNRRNGETGEMARGFFVWNSEVGDKTLGVAMFLFDFVCANRIVWGVEGYKEVRVRHTSGAPDRWLGEVEPVLLEYQQSSVMPLEATLKAAQRAKIDDLNKFMASRQFTARQAAKFQAAHEAEEGRPIETVWDATTAITAVAREMSHNDERVDLERRGGAVLDLVAEPV